MKLKKKTTAATSNKNSDKTKQEQTSSNNNSNKNTKQRSGGGNTITSPVIQLYESLPELSMNDHCFEISVTENLGIHVQPGRDEKNAFVQKVTSRTTAQSGVKKGQQLVAINGRSVLDLKFDQIRSIVSHTMKRKGANQERPTLRFMKKPRLNATDDDGSGNFEILAFAVIIICMACIAVILLMGDNLDMDEYYNMIFSGFSQPSSPHQNRRKRPQQHHHDHHHHDHDHSEHSRPTESVIDRNNPTGEVYPFTYDPHKSKPEAESVTLSVKLEQVYNAAQVSFRPPRGIQKICDACGGNGALHGNEDYIKTCPHCGGSGYEIITVQLAPGFVQRMESPCSHCGGSGLLIKHKCRHCGGEGTNIDKSKIYLYVPKGVEDGSSITLYGKGHQIPDHPPGDIHVTFRINEHRNFKRQGEDLHYTLSITLKEALLGFQKQIKHLDGHYVDIKSNSVQNCLSEIMIENEGMCNVYEMCGNLIVHFDCQFPRSVDKKKIERILKVAEDTENILEPEIIFNKKED